MRIGFFAFAMGCCLSLVWSNSADAYSQGGMTSPDCRGSFGYDANGNRHCNIAQWNAQHPASGGKAKKKSPN
jgi:hypothetical protein